MVRLRCGRNPAGIHGWSGWSAWAGYFGSPIDEIISENDFVPPGRTVQGSIEKRYAYVRLGTKLTVLTMLTEPGKLRLKAVSITLLILTEAG